MGIKKYLKSIIGTVIVATALVFGSASAGQFTNYTGRVGHFFMASAGYAVVIIEGSKVAGYHDGTNSAIATAIDNAKRLNQTITVSIDNKTYKILYVR